MITEVLSYFLSTLPNLEMIFSVGGEKNKGII